MVSRTLDYTSAGVLTEATSIAGELLQLSGLRDSSPGVIVVIQEGVLADMLLVNGDPLKDIAVLTKPEENLALIMKDGKIYKHTIH